MPKLCTTPEDTIVSWACSIAFGITIVSALAALSARETYRIPLEKLGERDAQPMPLNEYERLRAQADLEGRYAKS